MLYAYLEDYVDDIVTKSKESHQHVDALRKFFLRCSQYNLRMHPFEVCFGVSFCKFLRFTVHKKGINLDLTKAKTIRDTEPPTTCNQLKSFTAMVSYVCKFILAMAELLEGFISC